MIETGTATWLTKLVSATVCGLHLLPLLGVVGPAEAQVFAPPETLAERDRFGEPEATRALVAAFRALPPVAPPAWRDLKANWTFALGQPTEGPEADLNNRPGVGSPVAALPHTMFTPDTPFWYWTTLTLTEPVVLRVQADDGAQVFLDNRQIPCQSIYFPLNAPPGDHALTIRVKNGSYSGGLYRASVAPLADYERFIHETALRARLAKLVRKVRLLQAPTPAQLASAQNAVRRPDAATIAAAEAALSSLSLITVGPLLQNPATDRMTILFETDVPTGAVVEWGEGAKQTRKTPTQANNGVHSVTLTGLQPASVYAYRVVVGKTTSPIYRFRTLPATGSFVFTVWADSHIPTGTPVFRQNVQAMLREDLAFTVGVGDLVSDGYNADAWEELLQTLQPLAVSTPVALIPGNHDYDGFYDDLISRHYRKYTRNATGAGYSAWTCGNAFFLALDPNDTFPIGFPKDGPQYRWLQEQLNSDAYKRAKWRFLFVHQPPYSQTWLKYQGEPFLRDLVNEIADKHGLDFVVSGHTHSYERLIQTRGANRLCYLIVGGSGGGLEDGRLNETPKMDTYAIRHHYGRFTVEANRVVFEAVATDTQVLDRFEITK